MFHRWRVEPLCKALCPPFAGVNHLALMLRQDTRIVGNLADFLGFKVLLRFARVRVSAEKFGVPL